MGTSGGFGQKTRAKLINCSGGNLCSVAQLCPTLYHPIDCSLRPPLSMGLSWQEYWSGLPFPSPGDLPNPGDRTCISCISCTGRQILYHGAPWGFCPGYKPDFKPIPIIVALGPVLLMVPATLSWPASWACDLCSVCGFSLAELLQENKRNLFF